MSLEPKIEAGSAGHLRLFIAIAVPDAVRSALRQMQGQLQEFLPRYSATWTKPKSLHLTLRFLGNVNSTRLPELSQQFQSTLAGFGGLDLVCGRLGCFPDLRFPRVIWAGVRDEAKRLPLLHRKLEATVGNFAEKPSEARFVGHITLARLNQINRREAESLAHFVERSGECNFGNWRAESVAVFRSQLSAAGTIHEELLRAGLQ